MLPQPFVPLGSAWVCQPPQGSFQCWVCRLMLPNGLGWAWGAEHGRPALGCAVLGSCAVEKVLLWE